MSPTSRNTLMIGGALILIALLLVCGPLSGRFGSGGSTVEEAPPVSAGPPPVDAGVALGAAASGALAGATLGDLGDGSVAATANTDPCNRDRADGDVAHDVGREGTDCPPVAGADATVSDAGVGAGVVAAGTAVAAGATAAAATAGGSSGGGVASANTAASPPPVSAGVPSTPVSASGALPGLPVVAAGAAAAAASGAFDDAIVSAQDQNGGVSPAGRIVDRFAPPVAAPSNPGMRVASALKTGPLILPCDSPGSGCRNVSTGGGTRPPGVLNPPIIPGGRPTGPTRRNPPIVPGNRPTRSP